MKFSELVEQASDLLHRKGRLTYRALKREFDLDDEALADLAAELIDGQRVAKDEDGKVLVWVSDTPVTSSQVPVASFSPSPALQTSDFGPRTPDSGLTAGERRQLTVMFCDLVGSTALSAQLDPEELCDIVRAYQQTCAEVIRRHEGYIAQYLGDGLLVYFGYPTAHEDDAARAVRAGLEIVATVGAQHAVPLQVRVGIHTGLVVVGEMGGEGRHEQLALGETPNLAARIQGLAEPNTVIVSAATRCLIERQFECQPFGSHLNQTTQDWPSHRCGDEGREAQNLARVGAHGRAPLQTVSAAVYASPVVRFSLKKFYESGLFKIMIRGERLSDAQLLHHHKRTTIGEAPILIETIAIQLPSLCP